MPGLAPPVVTQTIPGNLDTGVVASSTIHIYFSTDLDPLSISDSTVILRNLDGSGVTADLVYNQRDRAIVMTPDQPLNAGNTYTLHVIGDLDSSNDESTGIKDLLGTPMVATYTAYFTVASSNLGVPLPLSPANQSTTVAIPTLVWSAVADAEFYRIQIADSPSFVNTIWTSTAVELQIDPGVLLDPDATYYWRVRAEMTSLTGDWGPTYNFFYGSPVDIVPVIDDPLLILGISPASTETNVKTTTAGITIRFNRAIDDATVTSDTIFVVKRSNRT